MPMLALFWQAAEAVAPDAVARRRAETATQPTYDHIDDITALWEGCRLANVRKAALEITLEFTSFADLWLPFFGGSTGLAGFARDLNEATADALANRVQEIVEREYGKSAFVLTARAWAVAGLVTGLPEPNLGSR